MPAIARLGDPSSHGGSIATASSNLFVNGIAAARAGDMHSCPAHGLTPLTSTSTKTNGGKSLVRVGDTAGCGAVITSGSPNVSAS